MDWVLITGASRGIGAGIAKKLAGAGFNLILWARNESDLTAVASECRALGVTAKVACVDVSNADSVASAGAATLGDMDSLRGCVINAGAATFDKISRFSNDAWRDVIAVNLDGAFFTLKATLPLLERRPYSQVIALGSQAALFGFEEQAGYCASKSGLYGLIETVRRETRSRGVRVSNLVLSGVDTFFRGKKPGDRPGSLEIDEVASVVLTLFTMPKHIEVREMHLSSMSNAFGPFPERYAEA
jgi:3-oxoacyl-[acyl-carrier protein] reductase